MRNNEEIDREVEQKPYTYFEQQLVQRVHHYYLSEGIGAPCEYVEMIHKIRSSGPNETIHIHLNTPGGRLDTGVQMVNAMRASEAHIMCSLESEAHSLGTLIFLAADEFLVHDNCMMMFHNYSGGTWGKGNEQEAQVIATIKWFNELAEDIYRPFLTEQEVQNILKGEDLWVHSEDIRKRLLKMVKIMEMEAKAELKVLEDKITAKEKKLAARAPKKKA